MPISAQAVEALRDSGFVHNRKIRRWVGVFGRAVTLSDDLVSGLELWELDQLIQAAKSGKKTVSLGPDRSLSFG